MILAKAIKNTWITPTKLYQDLNQEFKFELDAATSEDNPLNTPKFYTEKDDGLLRPWLSSTYCNPPYGRDIINWVKKAYDESLLGNLVVMLLPARTDTIWFHKYVNCRPRIEIRFLKGRLEFIGNTKGSNAAPFPSMIVIFHPS